ncbi:MFS transporter [Bifidobacterium catulorum]|nr:MFS transporter [Bifidobacterium catulorum]
MTASDTSVTDTSATTATTTVGTLPKKLSPSIFARLSVMMVIQYMTYGAWWATLGLVLSSRGLGSIVGFVYALAAVAAMTSPLLVGALADRFFASQKVMVVFHGCMGVVQLATFWFLSQGNVPMFLVCVFVCMMLYQPTATLTNNITFSHLPASSNAFSVIRAFGTLGWIIIGLFVGQTGLSASPAIFIVGAVMSFILSVYSITLPDTPPPAKGTRFQWGDIIGLGAFSLFRNRSFVTLSICLLVTAIPISIYNSYGSTYLSIVGVPNVASFMTIGQFTEILFLVILPIVLRFTTMKTVLVSGLVAWVVRAGIFLTMTNGNVPMAIIVVALHGLCNDFFVMASFMYIDDIAGERIRAQAQALGFFISFGIGNAIGSLTAGWFFNTFVGDSMEVSAWHPLWYLVAAITAVGSVLMIACFERRKKSRE